MGIDRIGKGGPGSSTPGAEDASHAGQVSRPFSVEGGAHTTKVGAVHGTEVLAPIDRLEARQVDVEAYLDQKVDQATSHLEGLSKVELDAIKKILRDQLTSDPALGDLVRQATGFSPHLTED